MDKQSDETVCLDANGTAHTDNDTWGTLNSMANLFDVPFWQLVRLLPFLNCRYGRFSHGHRCRVYSLTQVHDLVFNKTWETPDGKSFVLVVSNPSATGTYSPEDRQRALAWFKPLTRRGNVIQLPPIHSWRMKTVCSTGIE